MRRRVEKTKSFVKGAVLGGIACTIAALLMAPKSGKKLRQEIKCKYKDAKEGTQDAIEDFCEHTKGIAKETKDAAKKLAKGFKK